MGTENQYDSFWKEHVVTQPEMNKLQNSQDMAQKSSFGHFEMLEAPAAPCKI